MVISMDVARKDALRIPQYIPDTSRSIFQTELAGELAPSAFPRIQKNVAVVGYLYKGGRDFFCTSGSNESSRC